MRVAGQPVDDELLHPSDRHQSMGYDTGMSMSLAAIFREHVKNPDVHQCPPLELERRLHEILHGCRAAWPGIELPQHVFIRHLAENVPPQGNLDDCLARMHCTDLHLACGCAEGLPAAIAVFDSEIRSEVPPVLRRMGLATDQIDEVLQVVRTKLLIADGQRARPAIASYAGRGSLVGWVRIAARRAAISMGRNKDEQCRSDKEGDLERIALPSDLQVEYLKTRYQGEFKQAVEDALGILDAKHLNMLRFHYVDGLNIDRIGALLQVHRATAARWIRGAADAVRTEVQRLLRERLGLSAGEIDSLAGLVQSQLHVSISRLLKTP
jgi:RNA polymerase sigma-70 factor (ECF subfamily)